MEDYMKFKKFTALAVALAVMAGAMAPVTAGATVYSPEPDDDDFISIASSGSDDYISTVAAHRAAETAVLILGGNLITTDGVKDVMLDTFGSDYNLNPNQYLYNYRIEGYSDDYGVDGRIHLLTATVSPTMADLYGGSVETKAAIYLGNAANSSGLTYSSDLNSLAYNCTDIEEMEDTMNKLAAQIDACGSSLYGSAADIAAKYTAYVEETEEYIIDNRSSEMTVAILSVSDGTYTLYTSEYKNGTSINRAAEYLDDVTKNLVEDYVTTETDEDGNEVEVIAQYVSGTDEDGNDVYSDCLTYVTAGAYTVNDTSILTNAQAIVTTGFQGASTVDKEDLPSAVQTAIAAEKITLFNNLPDSSYGIYMNSAENALGRVGLITAIYEADDAIDVTCEEAVAYYYWNFYHIQKSYIAYLADIHFDECMNYDGLSDPDTAAAAVTSYAEKVGLSTETPYDNDDTEE